MVTFFGFPPVANIQNPHGSQPRLLLCKGHLLVAPVMEAKIVNTRFLTAPAQVLTWLLKQGNDLRIVWHQQDWFDTASAIATAAYGTPLAKEVRILSRFRNTYLLSNYLGQKLVSLYYKLSPPVAEYIKGNAYLKATHPTP